MGSTSTLAALIRLCSLSLYHPESQLVHGTSKLRRMALFCCGSRGESGRDGCDEWFAVAPAPGVLQSTHGDFDAIVGEDQRRVGRSELGSGHCD